MSRTSDDPLRASTEPSLPAISGPLLTTSLAPNLQDLLVLIVSSPSGAGKTTLCSRLLTQEPGVSFSVSHTTRPPRAGEVDGRDYHFVDPTRFRAMIAEGAFLEWAEVHGNLYGSSLSELARAKAKGSSTLLFDVDQQGARQIRARLADVVTVFILPPTWAELERRLVGRASDEPSVIARRLARARHEIEHYGAFDYLVINDDVDRAYERLRAIVIAEHARRHRVAGAAERLLRPLP